MRLFFSSDLSFPGKDRYLVLLLLQPEFKSKVWTLTEKVTSFSSKTTFSALKSRFLNCKFRSRYDFRLSSVS